MTPEPTPTPINEAVRLRETLFERVCRLDPKSLESALPALNFWPNDAAVLLLTITAALLAQKPDHALRFLQRFTKNWVASGVEGELLRLAALAQQQHWAQAGQIVQRHGLRNLYTA